jgi:hypothetical protein
MAAGATLFIRMPVAANSFASEFVITPALAAE